MTDSKKLDRRAFMTRTSLGGAAAVAGGALAAPAIAQEHPSINWRMASSFPHSLDVLFGSAGELAQRLAEASDGRFKIQTFAAGEIVPALDAINATGDGTVECAHSVGYYNWGRDPAFACGAELPFTFSARSKNAFSYHGGGIELYNQFLEQYNLVSYPVGNTGTQMGGWYRNEINSIEDMRGLKIRIGGLAGLVLERMGAVPQQIAAGDIYPSLERGTIDAAEWIGPYDDAKLGFQKVAPYYYYPGFWEGGPTVSLFVNKARWDALPDAYKSLLRTCCQAVDSSVLARYDRLNPAALKELVGGGAQLRSFSEDIMRQAFDVTHEIYAEISAENEWFKRQYEAMLEFRDDWYLYQQTAEYTFDTFMMIQQRDGALATDAG